MSQSRHDWGPDAAPDVLKARAALMSEVRAFFLQRGVTEVTTPVLSRAGIPDPNIPSVPATTLGGPAWLHTSPEFPMKRLLAAGMGDIYQICPVFRDGEVGQWHNPEFTLLEWYRLGLDERELALEVCELIQAVMQRGAAPRHLAATEWLTYRDAFRHHAGVDPAMDSDETVAEATIQATACGGPSDWSRADWLDLLGSTRVFPALGQGRITVVTDFPADQAALARLRPGDPPTAARFEVFLAGVELANGFHELADAAEQRARFEAEAARRRDRGLPTVAMDENLLAALDAGLPDCAGVALGLDRLFALALGQPDIQSVLTFSWDRA
ncbi:EF-P lysine aminoacylase EpmA [Natronospira bacteriovora]|uniref:EF-P lysine aminoacylase EpmA n=1 Tax=Natronospira bacteriovora TaxID=3069753 RepID=A0ABU0W3D3_9GAMM|nr:EF-P lysine aminoacylase EpmA [Natronospira sp. AB-CW4]MDQ2068525.1 EF-P lysine aminoacylase EpmA [Natronospira sp. AB-CW4]